MLTLSLHLALLVGPIPAQEGWTFTDVTEESGLHFCHSFGDDAFSFILEDTGSGVALIDHDSDGKLDVYLLDSGWLEGVSDPAHRPEKPTTNRLFRNLGGMRFEDVTEAAGVGDPGYGMGAVVGDPDGDGDDDLLVLNRGPNVMYRNDGGRFVDVSEEWGLRGEEPRNGQIPWSVNGSFLDFDRDGDLDLYVARYLAFDPAYVDPDLPPEYPYAGPDSYAGQASSLYRNDDGRFVDVTEELGLLRPDGKTMGAAIGDLDGDGRLDVFEAVDDAGNLLFHQQADGSFREIALLAGVAKDRNGADTASMHACIGDVDGDGLLDVFVPDLARGCLYRNGGELSFQDVSKESGLAEALDGSGAWGGRFADFDNDGDLDLLVVLGGAFDLAAAERDRLFLNDGEGHFTDARDALGGYFQRADVSRGAAFGDLDGDGDLDFVVSRKEPGQPVRVVRNDLPKGAHWLRVDLVGTTSAREAVGARVTLRAGDRDQVREMHRCASYLSSCEPQLHFGLGEHDAVQRLRVRWPRGRIEDFEVPGVDRVLKLVEGKGSAAN